MILYLDKDKGAQYTSKKIKMDCSLTKDAKACTRK